MTVLRADGSMASIGILVLFVLLAGWILLLRENVPAYRVGEYVLSDIPARVTFEYLDKRELGKAQYDAGRRTPDVYKQNGNVWAGLQDALLKLPDLMGDKALDQLSDESKAKFHLVFGQFTTDIDSASMTVFDQSRMSSRRPGYTKSVEAYVKALSHLIILQESQRVGEYARLQDAPGIRPHILIGSTNVNVDDTYSTEPTEELLNKLKVASFANFPEAIQSDVIAYTYHYLSEHPTHVLDDEATTARRNEAEQSVPLSSGMVKYAANRIIKRQGRIEPADVDLLRAEQQAYVAAKVTNTLWLRSNLGIFGIVLVVTLGLAAYIRHYQPRIVRNHARASAIVILLLSMLLMAQLAGASSGSLYLFGIAPTILVAMILAIAYDRRFAMGIAGMHAMLVTVGLNQGIEFFIVLLTGVFTCSYLLDDVRSRSKLVEVGGTTALAMMVATAVTGAITLQPLQPLAYIAKNVLHTGAAGLAVGFIVLGILPFIEKAFRITTSISLLEWADVSQPLMRRLAIEAPGTYNHSLQVATLAEEAAEAVGANSLLCRVGAYYHDIGKINKPDYFIENQHGGVNRHINLSPSVSLLIIIGHVKDGIEMAKEYNLPRSLLPFIQQHHGTTLVEYFYHQACADQQQSRPDQPAISEVQYRYPGPKPRNREIAILMMSDAVESATRAMKEPNAARIESLVHDLCTKRLLDGQFNECDLTMRELEAIERSLAKTLLGIYHGRIAYPGQNTGHASTEPQQARSTGKAGQAAG